MKFVEFSDVLVGSIRVGPRLRDIDEAWVEALAAMIESEGLVQPIAVYEVGASGLALGAGAHRLAAMKRLGRKTIRCNIFRPVTDKPEIEIRLLEIVENLGRRELSALDRATNLAELKRVHEELYPERKRGVAGGKARQGSATAMMALADEVAEKTGLSRRSFFRAVAIHQGLMPEVRALIKHLPIADNGAQLYRLSKADPLVQPKVARWLASGKAQSLSAAMNMMPGGNERVDPDTAAFKALVRDWTRAGAKARRRFLHHIGLAK